MIQAGKNGLDKDGCSGMLADMETAVTGRERLAQWITRSRLTQVEAAQRMDIEATNLSQILNGHRRPGLENAIKIQRATGIVVEAWAACDEEPVA